MQCGTAHIFALWHTVCGTVFFMFLISSHVVQRDILYSRNKESLCIFLCDVGSKEEVWNPCKSI